MATQNLATRYAKSVDERFHRDSQAMLALNNDYKFTGAQTVAVYSLPVVSMNDYQRSGTARYGAANDLGTSVQNLTVKRDRSFTFIIDKGDKIQSEMVSDAGKALARQLREVCIPEFDAYVFKTLAAAASERGAFSGEKATKENAYELFLNAMEYLGNRNVPDKGRVCFCSYKFANLLKQDSAFMRYGDKSQEMLEQGVIGEVDGCKIVKVPASRLPAGAAFLITHAVAATAPKQISDYKIHDNPPGISGWLVEGRMLYDCFVLKEKADAIFYHGDQPVLKTLSVITYGDEEITLMVNAELEGAARYYATAETVEGLPTVTYGTAITTGDWTAMDAQGATFVPAEGVAAVRIVEVDSEGKPIAAADTAI